MIQKLFIRGRRWTLPFMVLAFLIPVSSGAKTTRITLENGMEVIFRENHASPMITSIVFVRAGAKYENEFNNGVTHLLEHLLFDGTKNRSRAEISETIENHGGYINAFTRKDLTGYLVLMPKEYIGIGLDIQADQLFNSIFPEEELAKERKVVIEEIQLNNDQESNLVDDYFNAKSMEGTAYARPVLGYKNIIASIGRERIIEYWKSYYAPNNMIGLVIGDFDTEEMIAAYREIFGAIPPVVLPSPPQVNYFPPTAQLVHTKAGKIKQTCINLAIDAPHFSDPDYYAFDLMAAYLGDETNSPLARVLVDEAGQPLHQSFAVSLETQQEFSRLLVDVITDKADAAESIIAAVGRVLQDFDSFKPTPEILKGIKVSKKVDEIFMEERLHYYGFIVAPLLVTAGYDFLESYLDAIDKVNVTMMVRAADRWLDNLKYVGTVYHPAKEAGPDETEAAFTTYRREVFSNGLTVVVKSNRDSRVFALNVIGKNRSAMEPAGKDGITDFVNRLMEKGTTTLNAEALSNKLASIGAKITVCDNPWIPYDDRYTTRQYSFLKFETIDEFTKEGLALFADMIKNPAFDSSEVEKTRGMLMGIIGRQAGSTLDVCRNLFYTTLFEGQAYARTVNGSRMTVAGITREDLIAHHRLFYSPGNMIVTVGTNYDADSMMALLRGAMADMPVVDIAAPSVYPGPPVSGVKSAHQEMDKEQVYIFLGGLLPGASDSDAVTITLAAEILSNRLGQVLREEQGLAYSVGAGASFDREFGWYNCSIGTGAENFVVARDGILAQIEKLRGEEATSEEVETAKNSLWGSLLTSRLSRINQAFYMGVYEYLGRPYDYEKEWIARLRALTPADVLAAAQKYFDTGNYVLTTVGKI